MKKLTKIWYVILSILIIAWYIYLLSKNWALSNPFRGSNDYDYERDGCCSCCPNLEPWEMCIAMCCPCK